MDEVEEERRKNFLGKQNVYLIDFQKGQKGRMVTYWQGAPVIQRNDHNYAPVFFLQRSVIKVAAGEKVNTGNFQYKRENRNNFDRVNFQTFVHRNVNGLIRYSVESNGQQLFTTEWYGKKCEFVQFGPRWCYDGIGCINVFDNLKRGACMDCMPNYREAPAEYNTKHRFLEGCNCHEF